MEPKLSSQSTVTTREPREEARRRPAGRQVKGRGQAIEDGRPPGQDPAAHAGAVARRDVEVHPQLAAEKVDHGRLTIGLTDR